jgi:outer membrane protein assembly factor BamD
LCKSNIALAAARRLSSAKAAQNSFLPIFRHHGHNYAVSVREELKRWPGGEGCARVAATRDCLRRDPANCMTQSSNSMRQKAPLPALTMALRLAGGAALVLSASACSSIESFNPAEIFYGEKYKTNIKEYVTADEIYNQAIARLNKKDYAGAAKKFADLDKQYPYSQWQRKGLLMTTFAQYQNGNYDDAIGSAQRYIGLYPNSQDLPYIYYLAAMSYYNQIPEISRDQDRAEKAATYFSHITEKYPNSEYAEDARYKLQVTRDQLAGKEMLVGRYYLNKHNYAAAINRFRVVLAKYQSTRHAEEALMRLTEAYLALGIPGEAQTAAAVLGHNFPDSEWYKDAHARLQSGGLEPHENKDSWISKAFSKMGLG